jgi:hypothetical protein
MLAASEAYFQSIRDVNILDPDSPYYRARDLCIMDRTKFWGVLNFVYGSTRNHSQECSQLNIPSITIFQILSKHGNEGLFVTTPELFEAELKIVFDDIIFDFLVRRRNKPYSLLLNMCLNEDGKEDFGKQRNVVKALKENHRGLEDLENMWDGIIQWSVSVLEVRWWERFE